MLELTENNMSWYDMEDALLYYHFTIVKSGELLKQISLTDSFY